MFLIWSTNEDIAFLIEGIFVVLSRRMETLRKKRCKNIGS
jgi:hypothetical protein